uniref:Uncharacterized protein n=1 Tax=Fervidobacterium pennivorans TaxID=93466 RepID=A0A7V4NFN9_FERPE
MGKEHDKNRKGLEFVDEQWWKEHFFELVFTYQACLAREETIRLSYKSLLTNLEVAFYLLFFMLLQLNLTNYIPFLCMAGLLLCFAFGAASEFHAVNADYWEEQIVRLIASSPLKDIFGQGKYKQVPLGKIGRWGQHLAGHWFEKIAVLIMVLAWLFILWRFLSNPLVCLVFTFMALVWFLYVFHVLDQVIKWHPIPPWRTLDRSADKHKYLKKSSKTTAKARKSRT